MGEGPGEVRNATALITPFQISRHPTPSPYLKPPPFVRHLHMLPMQFHGCSGLNQDFMRDGR